MIKNRPPDPGNILPFQRPAQSADIKKPPDPDPKEGEREGWKCICGCRNFNLFKDGTVECASCESVFERVHCYWDDDPPKQRV
tara:strand:+ start:80 stop:328 length:249 start_codon:yes stop_codon:yes gene_type:complete